MPDLNTFGKGKVAVWRSPVFKSRWNLRCVYERDGLHRGAWIDKAAGPYRAWTAAAMHVRHHKIHAQNQAKSSAPLHDDWHLLP